jgi:hypothetical protein
MFRKNKKKKLISKWSSEDRQNFSDRNFLKAKTIPSKKKSPPDKSEWE